MNLYDQEDGYEDEEFYDDEEGAFWDDDEGELLPSGREAATTWIEEVRGGEWGTYVPLVRVSAWQGDRFFGEVADEIGVLEHGGDLVLVTLPGGDWVEQCEDFDDRELRVVLSLRRKGARGRSRVLTTLPTAWSEHVPAIAEAMAESGRLPWEIRMAFEDIGGWNIEAATGSPLSWDDIQVVGEAIRRHLEGEPEEE